MQAGELRIDPTRATRAQPSRLRSAIDALETQRRHTNTKDTQEPSDSPVLQSVADPELALAEMRRRRRTESGLLLMLLRRRPISLTIEFRWAASVQPRDRQGILLDSGTAPMLSRTIAG